MARRCSRFSRQDRGQHRLPAAGSVYFEAHASSDAAARFLIFSALAQTHRSSGARPAPDQSASGQPEDLMNITVTSSPDESRNSRELPPRYPSLIRRYTRSGAPNSRPPSDGPGSGCGTDFCSLFGAISIPRFQLALLHKVLVLFSSTTHVYRSGLLRSGLGPDRDAPREHRTHRGIRGPGAQFGRQCRQRLIASSRNLPLLQRAAN